MQLAPISRRSKLAPRLVALGCALLAPACLAADYLGMLKPPSSGLGVSTMLYSFASLPGSPSVPDNGFGLKLGYKYSRYLAVEGEFNDSGRMAPDPFASPYSASQFRASGFGVDTIATLPVWHFSFYGRLGAYHGDPRNPFSTYTVSLLGDGAAHTRLRYGLGMRYNITDALGIRAEVERYTPLGTPLTGDPEGDLFSVGVSWRF